MKIITFIYAHLWPCYRKDHDGSELLIYAIISFIIGVIAGLAATNGSIAGAIMMFIFMGYTFLTFIEASRRHSMFQDDWYKDHHFIRHKEDE